MQTNKITTNEINNNINKNLEQYVLECEQTYKNQVQQVVDYVLANKNIKFIFLAGPSGSGKTTSSLIMSKKLKENGIITQPISLDDFFVNRDETPLWDDGEPNYETFEAIDWKLFEKCMSMLLNGAPVKLPTYNFSTGMKEFDKETTLQKNTIFVVEGLHALNPIVGRSLPQNVYVNVFIAPETDIYHNNEMIIEHHKVRLFRRLIRDLYTRSTSLKNNIAMWKKVRLGEKLYISPFKDNAKLTINSFHGYELGVYKNIFCNLKTTDECRNEICEMLKDIEPLDISIVPADSVLQEFMPKK